jgi:glyoxylase-like metal-dependent hydrolase (beta-lactamase superfamily II)
MKATKLADNVYQAGRYGGFSVFYDAGEYFIAAGGYYELTKRFEKVKALSKLDKPLKYLVVSHHHDDHLSGMKEAADLGVNFITVKDNIDSIRESAKVELADDRFTIVENQGEFANGEVKVLDFVNEHAKHNLMTYFSSAKTLSTADMYFSRDVLGVPRGEKTHKALKLKINQAGFDVVQLAAAHSSKLLTMDNLDESIANTVPVECPAHWEICVK